METPVHFFKVLIGNFQHCLRIPPAFVKYMKNGITQATLECPNGMIHHVKLQEKTSGLYFQGGWKEFVQDHSLREHYVLVFRYEGDAKFSLEVYDQSACDRKDECIEKAPLQLTLYDQRKKQAATQRKKESLDLHMSSCQETSTGETESQDNSSEHVPQKAAGRCAAFDFVQGRCIPPKHDGLAKIKTANIKRSSTKKVDLRKLSLAGQKAGAHEKANSFTSKFPYFVVELTSSNIGKHGMLRIPIAFSAQHLPRQRKRMTLQGPDGRLWDLQYVWSHGRAILSGGWVAFSRDNGLGNGDFCVFELLDKNKIRVHIFHLVE